jgi:hypothetical protein
MLELRLKPGGLARYDPFLFCAVPGHTLESTSPTGLGQDRPGKPIGQGIAWPGSPAFVLGLRAGIGQPTSIGPGRC